MINVNLGEKGLLFARIIWKNEPLTSKKLTEICQKELDWKRTTTYTMLKNLCEKGICENKDGIVSSLISEEEFGAIKGDEVIEENFGGSLPKFLTAFTGRNKLSKKDIEEIQSLIDNYEEEE